MDDQPPFHDPGSIAQSVFDSIPDPLVVLDKQWRIIAASRSFRSTFGIAANTNGDSLFDVLENKWDFPELRRLLATTMEVESGALHEAIEHEPICGEGATLFGALAKQLGGVVATSNSDEGYSVALTRSTFKSRMPKAN